MRRSKGVLKLIIILYDILSSKKQQSINPLANAVDKILSADALCLAGFVSSAEKRDVYQNGKGTIPKFPKGGGRIE